MKAKLTRDQTTEAAYKGILTGVTGLDYLMKSEVTEEGVSGLEDEADGGDPSSLLPLPQPEQRWG